VLLGIKYEAARIGEVSDDALAGIEEQMKRRSARAGRQTTRSSADAML
jgi:hypothetical protein